MRAPRPPVLVMLGIALLAGLALTRSGEIRQRASAGLGQGMPPREAELARGFVLGEDGKLDAGTREDFRRSGLSHLLAVSGENVTLLALLAMPVLGTLGIPLRERLVWVLALIAVYVPVAGAAPSIQRAAVMGALGLLATLAGRRSSRFFALALAALVTLSVDPTVGADVGWQLSFAAVLGILILAGPLREAILERAGRGRWRRALAEGAAVTIAATLATAPLIAFHFETLSTTTLLANLLAMPAVAPAMWLGMITAAAAQMPGLPLAPLNGLDAIPLAYVAQVAAWCGRPRWAELHVHLGPAGLVSSYLGLGLAFVACLRAGRIRRLARARRTALPNRVRHPPGDARRRATAASGNRLRLAVTAVATLLAVAFLGVPGGNGAAAGRAPELLVAVLDVGQGDAILFRPRAAPAVLVDGGPPGDDLHGKLVADGVGRLGAAVITHDQADHAGGVEELLGRMPVDRLLYGRLRRPVLAAAAADGARPRRLAAGDEVRSGALRLQVVWPPAQLLAAPAPPGEDPNQQALVMVARWHRFRMLLTADAEAESVPIDPGPVDVLKVAHHGSDDAGLGNLLDRARPRLAVISVGAGNPYGHPTAGTLATLGNHRVPVLRTDLDGEIDLELNGQRFGVSTTG